MKKRLLLLLRSFLIKAQPGFLSKIKNFEFLHLLQFQKIAIMLLLLIPCLAKAQYTSDRASNLNIIYFVPNDLVPVNNYQTRLSTLFNWAQNWYGDQMAQNGYNKTFGLYKNGSDVKITTIYGTKGKSAYTTSSVVALQAEVNAYWAAHPGEKTSVHTLVIMPRFADAPFYGLDSKWCFAVDDPSIDIVNMGKSDAAGNDFTKWFGGMVHELGHGLNLAHNRQKASENDDPNKGMSLMWAGNGTLGKTPTFLTATDCAILNANQIFNTDTKTYYGAVNASIKRIHANYSGSKKAIVVSGKFITDTPVNSVVFYNDPNSHDASMVYEGTGVNNDYNAITWETKTVGVDSFYVEMPINELVLKDDLTPYELKVKLVHNNGNVTQTIYNYNFSNGVPVINFGTMDEISKATWTIVANSEQTTAPATNMIDNDLTTAWHSQYSTSPAATYPHTITINLGKSETLYGYTIANMFGRPIKDAELLYSTDGVNYTSLGDFVIAKSKYAQNFAAGPLTFQYFKIIAKSSWDGLQFAQIGEIGFYKEQEIEPVVSITSPADNALIPFGKNINITASASDIGGQVFKVEFFNRTTKLGEDLTEPYNYNWTNVPVGDYIINAKVTDNSGTTSISKEVPVSVKVVENLLPTADSYVRDGSTATTNFGSAATIVAKKDAAGFNRIAYLKFNLDQYQTDTFDIGKLKLVIQAAGTGSTTADFQLWYCNNDSWTETGVYWNNKPALTTLLDTQKGKATGSTIEWDIKNQLKTEINGDKTLTLAIVSNTQGSAYDLNFHSKEATGDVLLKPQIIVDFLPNITLTSPADGAIVNQGNNLALSANATDDKAVANVKFFVNGVEKATVTTSPYIWNAANLEMGTYVIKSRVTDSSGLSTDTAPVTVTVKDLTAPVINCPENILVNNDENQCGANVSFATTATDNFSDVTITYSQDPGSLFPIGTTKVLVTAKDVEGNSSTCSFDVTVSDHTAPTIVCPGNITLTACQETAIWSLPVANDNCSNVTVTQAEGPASGSTFTSGTTTTISYEAKDASGNISTCSFTVTRQTELDLTVSNSNPQLYFGYAPNQSSTITGIPTGGIAPYTVSITMDRPLKSNVLNSSGDEIWTVDTNTNSITATLLETAIITVTVTDANGCSVSKTTTVNAEDVRCIVGNKTNIKVCHKAGNSNDFGFELCVSPSAVKAHLDHGDALGSCSSSNVSTPRTKLEELYNKIIDYASFDVKTYPNPSRNQFTLVVEGSTNEKIEVTVYNILARIVKHIEKNDNEPIIFGQEFNAGQYIAIIKQGDNTKVIHLVKL